MEQHAPYLEQARRRLRAPASERPEEYLNGSLLGQRGAVDELATPALVLDLERFERNLKHMQDHCTAAAIGLRPHAKTHKCPVIAHRQLAAGAVGICCAKLGEAETMLAAGIGRILLTSPVVTAAAITRLLAAAAAADELLVVVDNPSNIAQLNEAALAAGQVQDVLLDLDPGLHRTGIEPGPDALSLAQQIDRSSNLKLRGLQMYAGHLQHVHSFAERDERSSKVMAVLAEFRRTMAAAGLPCEILSGGGTGTFDIDPRARVLNELQAGSYLFMDRQYNVLEPRSGTQLPFFTALFVQTRIVSCNRAGLATTDAGLKAFATDDEAPPIHEGGPQGSQYFFFGDEQGGLRWQHDAPVRLGEPVRAVTPHCDPTVNLYDDLHVIRGDELVDIWPIDARGRGA
ncbi:MAG: DSD1 family PLP-dependent enzyme [Pseudomonadota bacterium]